MASRRTADGRDEATTAAVQLRGGHGRLRSRPAEKLMRDAKLMATYEGIDRMQHTVIARDALTLDEGGLAAAGC